MFTLRDQVWPDEAGSAQASLSDFRSTVGDLCEDVDDADAARARAAKRLGPRLRRADSPLDQRDVLLDGVNRVIARSGNDLSKLRGLEAPATLAAQHEATADAWQRNLDRMRHYARMLDDAGTRGRLHRAVETLARFRAPIAADSVTVRAGLRRLGGDECDLDDPIAVKPVTLPPRPAKAKKPPAVTTPDPSPAPAPAPAPPPPTVQPPQGGVAPPNDVAPPTTPQPPNDLAPLPQPIDG